MVETCHHCPEELMSGLDLLNHLKSSQHCCEKYTTHKSSPPLGVIFKQFGCLFCGLKKGKSLRVHLEDSLFNCKIEFCKFFNIAAHGDVTEQIMRKVINSKRMNYPSRNPENRRQENPSTKKKKGFKRFLKETAVGPSIYFCSLCGISGTRRQIINVNQELKQCRNCQNGVPEPEDTEPFINSKYSIVDFSGMIGPEEGINSLANERFSTALLPSSYFSLEEFSFPRVPNSNQKHVRDIYRGLMNYAEVYPLIYEQEVKKVTDCNISAILPGRISNLQKREIQLYNPPIQTSKIPGTDDYYHRGQVDVLHAISQIGPIFLMTEVNIQNKPLALFATAFLLDANGRLRLDVIFDSGTHEASYKVHLSHTPEEECPEDCLIQDLQSLIDSIKDADKKVSLATSANCIQNFFIKFYNLMICDPDSLLYSSLYDANMQFPLDASFSRATVASWPEQLTILNQKIAQNDILTRNDVNNFLNYVDSVLTTSVSVSYLQDQFNLDPEVANEVSKLAQKHQLKRDLEKCQQMPSIMTMVKQESKLENKEEISKLFNSFLDFMEIKLLCLEMIQLEMDPESWLMTVEEESGFQIYVIDDFIHLMLSPQVCYHIDNSVHLVHPPEFTLVFPFKPETQDLIENHGLTLFQGLYHRALSFSLISSLQVIHKSTMLLDAFILPYSPSYILAARSSVTSYFVGENQKAAVKKLKCTPKSPNFAPGDPLEIFATNHKQVTLMESIYRYDRNKSLSKSNVKPIFINISKQRRLKFIKSKGENPSKLFKSGSDFYEIFEDNYDKYLLKKISSGKICCYEFLAWFNKSGDDSEDRDNGDDGDDGENGGDGDNGESSEGPKMSLTNDDWLGCEVQLPLKIELTNGDTYIRRKKQKIVSFPDTRSDPEAAMFRDIILFKHHTSREELENLTTAEILNIYNEKDIFPEENFNGKQLTKIETVRTRCNPAMMHMEVNFDVNDEESEFVKYHFDY